jgi:hypothetical protein
MNISLRSCQSPIPKDSPLCKIIMMHERLPHIRAQTMVLQRREPKQERGERESRKGRDAHHVVLWIHAALPFSNRRTARTTKQRGDTTTTTLTYTHTLTHEDKRQTV